MKPDEKQKILSQYPADYIINKLAPYVTQRRQQRITKVLDHRVDSIQLALESPSDIHNALATIRTSEALGICRVHIIAAESEAKATRRVTQGAIDWIEVSFYQHLADFLQHIKKTDYDLAGAIMTAPQQAHQLAVTKPLCLLLGNENRGLSKDAIAACDRLYAIPMHGMSESLNLSVCAAISLYDTIARKRQALNSTQDLSPSRRTELMANYYLNGLHNDLVQALLKQTQTDAKP